MLRVVSLIASATEIVSALGFGDWLVGRSHECDFPEDVERLPVCTRPKLRTDTASRDIDRSVKSLIEQGLSVYHVDAERLRQLDPQVIITQDHCEVCAVSLKDVEKATRNWLGLKPTIVSLRPDSLDDVWADIRRVAAALGDEPGGHDLVLQLRARMDDVSRRAHERPERPAVACIEWIDPLMAAGNWMPELVRMAAGTDLFGKTGKHSPRMTWEELRESDPDVIFVSPCGMTIEQSEKDMPVLARKDGWSDLKAVQTDQVYLADGNAFFNRPGPRLVESLEILAEILHPGRINLGHGGVAWRPYRTNE